MVSCTDYIIHSTLTCIGYFTGASVLWHISINLWKSIEICTDLVRCISTVSNTLSIESGMTVAVNVSKVSLESHVFDFYTDDFSICASQIQHLKKAIVKVSPSSNFRDSCCLRHSFIHSNEELRTSDAEALLRRLFIIYLS